MDLILKTPRGMEDVVASHVEGYLRARGVGGNIEVRPHGSLGIVLVSGLGDAKLEVAKFIRENIPEVSRVLVVEVLVEAELERIAKAAAEVAKRYIEPGENFGVRTTRRGSHGFTSIEVNVVAGKAIQEATGAEVNLDYPDKAIYVEIFHDKAAIAVVPGPEELSKMVPGKPITLPILRKLTIVQMPYTGPREGVRKMGVRVGRAAQTFEVGELYVAHYRPVSMEDMLNFLEGIREGIESRYEIQRRTYGRPVHKVPVYVYDLYQFVREHRDEPIIVTDPRGTYITHVKDKLAEVFRGRERVHVLIGAREGIPTGIFRFATLTIDLIPQVTIATDYALTATVIALVAALEEAGALERFSRVRKKGQGFSLTQH